MSIKTAIVDPTCGNIAMVTRQGQVITAPIAYSGAYNAEANLDDTAFNLVVPIAGKRFVLTDILLYANKGVGVNDATVQLYEATAPDTTTVYRAILTFEMVKQTARDFTGLNLICSEGRWINIKTDDNTIFATVTGYYIDA